jgi:hypothetical protein
LNAVVVALKALEREAEATELIQYVIAERKDDRSFFKLTRALEPITDPELKAALQAHAPVVRDDRSLSAIILGDGISDYQLPSVTRLWKLPFKSSRML